MEITIQCRNRILHAYAMQGASPKACILFLSGGSVTLGKERFAQWQHDLMGSNIASISFDYSGVHDSDDVLKQSSLSIRIEEAACVARWVKRHVVADVYILYGVSMGGYIALGLIDQMPQLFHKIVLHAPAAYASCAHDVPFGSDFSDTIRVKESWQDSNSFQWLSGYQGDVLLISAKQEEIIPKQLLSKYQCSIRDASKLQHVILPDAKHDIWGSDSTDLHHRNQVYQALLSFVSRI